MVTAPSTRHQMAPTVGSASKYARLSVPLPRISSTSKGNAKRVLRFAKPLTQRQQSHQTDCMTNSRNDFLDLMGHYATKSAARVHAARRQCLT